MCRGRESGNRSRQASADEKYDCDESCVPVKRENENVQSFGIYINRVTIVCREKNINALSCRQDRAVITGIDFFSTLRFSFFHLNGPFLERRGLGPRFRVEYRPV